MRRWRRYNDRLRSERVVRLVGLSGLGKTRLALEVFRPPERSAEDFDQQSLSDQVAYVDAEIAGSDVFRAIQSWRQNSVRGVVVVDNCDKALHNKLEAQIKHQDSHLGLLTIGPDPEPDTSSGDLSPLVQLHPVDDKVIEEILKHDYSALPKGDLEFIIKELARGFPQMAVLIAEARLQKRDGRNSHDILLRKLLGAPPDAQSPAFEVISHCALFEHLGIVDATSSEYKWVAKFAGINPDHFFEHVSRFQERGILSKHGHFVQVRPKPLAMQLAADWWSRCSPERALRLLEGDIPERLAAALCERVRILDYVPAVCEFVERLCGEQRPFGQREALDS